MTPAGLFLAGLLRARAALARRLAACDLDDAQGDA